ncbi:transmembrane amino acid transporter protein-domain-containing protein [Lipomyces arxii]|uniref:transmembrane amino acid transporter protein-domain-containing protein n=1 Tax=Lipomyces arxii TaxID=56418 RepID=UPI0034CD893F
MTTRESFERPMLGRGRFSIDSDSSDDDLGVYQVDDYDPANAPVAAVAANQMEMSQEFNPRQGLLSNISAPAVLMAGGDEEVGLKKNGMKMAFMNMANSIIGAGIIGQPYALLQCGLITGVVALVTLTFVIDWTIRLMVVNAKLSGTNTYQATVSACFGRAGYLTISLAQGLFAFGGSIAFTVIIGDTIPHVVSAVFPSAATIPVIDLLTERSPVMIICVLFISFPLSLSKNIANLAKASLLALISMLIIILAVVVEGIRLPSDQHGNFSVPLLTMNKGVFQGMGVISFAFVCHHNSLLIYGALRKPTLDRFAKVTHWSTGVSMVACMVLALAGFLTFRDKTEGNVLNNFASNNLFINLARFCFGFNMLTTFPLEIFVCREVLLDYISSSFQTEVEDESGVLRPPEPSAFAHNATTAGLTILTLVVALMTSSLGIVLEVVGSTSACMLAYILPPLCYLKLARSNTQSLRQKLAPIACVGFGVVVMIVSTVMTITKAF